MSDLLYPEAHLPHLNIPIDDLADIRGRSIAHVEPAVFLPPEQWNLINLCFLTRCHNREPAMRDDDVHIDRLSVRALVVVQCSVQATGCQVVQLRQVGTAVPYNR